MSTVTGNLSLVKYDVGDKVTPSGFNDNFTKIDEEITSLKKDYVASVGTQTVYNTQGARKGTWNYRRWEGGLCEYWYTHTGWFAGVGHTSTQFELPVNMASDDYIVLMNMASDTIAHDFYNNLTFIARSKATNSFVIDCWNDSNDSTYVDLSIYITGRWK